MQREPHAAEAIRTYYHHFYADLLGLPDVEERIEARLALGIERAGIARFAASSAYDPSLGPVLDLGCGTGGTLVALCERYPNAELAGIDPDADAIFVAEQRLREARINARLLVGGGESLPFGDGEFGAIVCHQVLEHVRDPAQVLREMGRVVRYGGCVHITAPSYSSAYEAHYKLKWPPYMGPIRAHVWLRWKGRPTGFVRHINFLTSRQLMKWSEAAGFRVRHISRELDRHRAASILGRLLRRKGNAPEPFVRALGELGLDRLVEWMFLTFRLCDHEYVLYPR